MTPEEITEMRVLVAKARARTLTLEERGRFELAFTALEQSLKRAQLLLAPRGAMSRRSFRVVCELDADLVLNGVRHRSRTQNFSLGGFAALLAEQPAPGARVPFALWFSPEGPPLEGVAVCRASLPQDGRWRGCFEFADLTEEAAARLKLEVLDVALEMLWPSTSLES